MTPEDVPPDDLDPAEVEPTDNSLGAPVDENNLKEVEREVSE